MNCLRILFFLFLVLIHPEMHAQDKNIPVLNFSAFEKYLNQDSDTVFVINFCATWCGPCRRELPEFEKIHETYSHEKVRVLLVSLDFPSMLEKGLKTYLKNNLITARVLLLDEPDANAWIDKVDKSWTGSLPATLVYKGKNKLFYEKELSYQDISGSIHSLTNL
jgi:thiol-disulfide isomerase/thioredoxin